MLSAKILSKNIQEDFSGEKSKKIPCEPTAANIMDTYGFMDVYGLLKKTPASLLFFFFFFLLLPPSPLFLCKPHIHPPTPPQSDKEIVVTLQKKERSGRGRKT